MASARPLALTLRAVLVVALGAFVLPSGEAAAQAGRSCGPFAPCPSGYNCHPLVQQCFNVPRQAGQPCGPGFACGRGLECEPGVQRCRRRQPPAQLEQACGPGQRCARGLSCQAGVQQCFNVPRRAGQPCGPGAACADGLHCQAGAQVCIPDPIDRSSARSCGSFQSADLTLIARDMGGATSYGIGASAGVGVVESIEEGTVYGADGEFGCYIAVCGGVQTDVSISTYATFGAWRSWDAFAGQSFVMAQGVSIPVIEGGFTTSQALDTRGTFIGSVNNLTFGVGLLPVQVAGLTCCTAVLEDYQTVNALNDSIEMCRQQIEALVR